MIRWGWVSGVASGLALAAAAPFLGPVFSRDPAVHAALVPVLLVAALGQPVAGVVFVLDGVLIGAGDGRYLAWAGLVVLVVYAPVVIGAALFTGVAGGGMGRDGQRFMGAWLVVLLRRARGDACCDRGPLTAHSEWWIARAWCRQSTTQSSGHPVIPSRTPRPPGAVGQLLG
ncbi:MAG: hypothetical protein R2731_08095 [Nocardioides sp.]